MTEAVKVPLGMCSDPNGFSHWSPLLIHSRVGAETWSDLAQQQETTAVIFKI